MPRIVLLVLLAFSLLQACASPQLWTARTAPGCQQPSGDPELERERSYVATLLALNERGYAILRADWPREIEADYVSDYRPEISHSRWLISIQPDASLLVDTPPDMREMHERSERWYRGLVSNVQRLQCRDLNWLRWEAQNRGLLPIGAAGIAVAPPPNAGGEQVNPGNGVVNPNAKRLSELERQRAHLHVARAITWSAVGAGTAVFSMSLVTIGAIDAAQPCVESEYGSAPDCSIQDVGHALMWTGAATGVVAAIILGVAGPRMIEKLRTHRALGKEIKALRATVAPLNPAGPGAQFGLSLRGTF